MADDDDGGSWRIELILCGRWVGGCVLGGDVGWGVVILGSGGRVERGTARGDDLGTGGGLERETGAGVGLGGGGVGRLLVLGVGEGKLVREMPFLFCFPSPSVLKISNLGENVSKSEFDESVLCGLALDCVGLGACARLVCLDFEGFLRRERDESRASELCAFSCRVKGELNGAAVGVDPC